MSVSVQNIYYLLCYAWDRLEARSLVDVSSIPGTASRICLARCFRMGWRISFEVVLIADMFRSKRRAGDCEARSS